MATVLKVDERENPVQAFQKALKAKISKAIDFKAQSERIWTQDLMQYHGASGRTILDKIDRVQGYSNDRQVDVYAPPPCNKTLPKTEIAAARISDMLFPSHEQNWDMKPTPVPEMPLMQKTDPEGAKEFQDEVERRCNNMKKLIKDQLTESNYNKHGRAAIFDAVQLGTGVIKGPFVRGRIRRSYQPLDEEGAISGIDISIAHKPSVSRVEPWNFFPAACRNMEECDHVFELHPMTRVQLQQLANTEGFSKEAIGDLLALENIPMFSELASLIHVRAQVTGENLWHHHMLPVWEYHGPLNRADDLITLGLADAETDPDDLRRMLLEAPFVEIWFCHDQIIKAALTPLEAWDRLPYYVFNYYKNPNSVFGFGLPYVMRADQTVIDTTYAAMVYNVEMSAGPQIGTMKGKIQPKSGDWEIRGPKVWELLDEDYSLKDCLQFENVPNTVADIMPLHELARQNADEVTNLPMLAQGEAKHPVPTSSGLALLTNLANVVQRRSATNWDDDVTTGLLPAMYHYNMVHSTDPDVKGDFDVFPIGATHLLAKDLKAQHIQSFTALTDSPRFQGMTDDYRLLRENLTVMDVSPDLVRPKDEVEAERQQAGPGLEQQELELKMKETDAKIATLQAELELAKAKLVEDTKNRERDDERQRLEVALRHEQVMTEMDTRARVAEMQVYRETLQQQTELIRIASREKTDVEAIRAKLISAEMQEQGKRIIAGIEARQRAHETNLRRQNLELGHDTYP